MPRTGPLLLLLTLLLAPPGAAAQDDAGWEDGFTFVSSWATLAGYDVHGARLAWMARTTTGVDLILNDLETGDRQVLTSIPAPPDRTMAVGELDFDGRWVTWNDNRFGNLDVFALDVQSGLLTRVSESFDDDEDPALDGGRVAWSREGRILVHDLDNGTTWTADTGPGKAIEPALAGEALAWIRIHENRRYVVAADVAGRGAQPLSDLPGSYAHALAGEGQVLAWETRVLWVAGEPEKGFKETVVQAVRDLLGGGVVQNVSAVPEFQAGRGSPLALDVGGDRIAWLDPTERETDIRSVDLATGNETTLASKARALGISDRYAVAFDGEPGSGHFRSRPWEGSQDEGGQDKDAPGPGLALLALGLLAIASQRRRR